MVDTKPAKRVVCHMDFWSSQSALKVTITTVAGDQGLRDIVVSSLPAGAKIIAVQGMFMCDTVQNTAVGATNYLDWTMPPPQALYIKVWKKVGGTEREAILMEAEETFNFTTDMIRGGTCFVGDWARATHPAMLTEVDGNNTYQMWFDYVKALADSLVLYGVAFGLRIWFTI